MDLSKALSSISIEPSGRVTNAPSVKKLPQNEVQQEIKKVCFPNMHYADLTKAIGKLTSVKGISFDILIENHDFFNQFISIDSSVQNKTVLSVISSLKNAYADQVGSRVSKTAPVYVNDLEPGEPEIDYKEKFKSSILDQKKEYPLPVPVINLHQNGSSIPLFTKKSLSLLQGKQKTKKTTVLAIAVASMLRENERDEETVFFSAPENGTVLFIDTEMGESYGARQMNLVLKIAGVDTSERLIYCDFRELTPKERMEAIKAGIECTPNIKLVVIDGVVDLLNDFMDAKEGHLAVTELLKLCSFYNIHITVVLHQNKADKNARAHIGTISSQKCEIEISTEIDPDDRNQSIVSCVNSRGLPFEQFAIRWDKGSLPCINQDWSPSGKTEIKEIKKYEDSKNIMDSVFTPISSYSFTEAKDHIMKSTMKSESTAKRLLNEWKSWGLISLGPDGRYRKNNNQGSKVHDGSNAVHEP